MRPRRPLLPLAFVVLFAVALHSCLDAGGATDAAITAEAAGQAIARREAMRPEDVASLMRLSHPRNKTKSTRTSPRCAWPSRERS